MRCAAALIWIAAALPACAQDIQPLPYDLVEQTTQGREDFQTLPDKPYPGYNLDRGYAFNGGLIGQHFAGQTVETLVLNGDQFDAPGTDAPIGPLRVEMGPPGQTLSISLHRVFGSNALYPLGPLAQPTPEGRGEGMIAIGFDRDICRFGIKVHTEYLDALGSNAAHQGEVEFRFYARDGAMLAAITARLPGGVSDLGFGMDGAGAIAGVTIANRDKGGISLDDMRFGCPQLLG
ncbi:hypothetical protein [Actibacterium sp. XHP0104]|uniref:hypothetical protein n=1 Tax=Actibacterium sp. XHP0104 TaxID=2984335 RepID=UPI0021E75979|nr:hypothetical protein [Actibacterium sp. XHP0104]MCV2882594.1 hypothetical protein [Actibacterium sp. XHP0104]